MSDIAFAMGVVAFFCFGMRTLFVWIPNWRIARCSCPRCVHAFGNAAAVSSEPYYHRLFGRGTVVFDGPRRYLGARVAKCGNCEAEFVFSELGRLVEPFDPQRDPLE